MQKKFPSVQMIQKIKGVDFESVKLARFVMQENNRETLESLPVYRIYWQKIGKLMHNPHSLNELKMRLLDIILKGYGVESCEVYKNSYLDYVNFGDTYDLTICYYQGRFSVNSWGDIVENEPRSFVNQNQ